MMTREALPRKTTGVMFNDIKSIPTDPTVDPPPRVCQNCWRKGHYRSKCPKKVTEASCENCGRKFHTVATCPRCAEGYRRFLLNDKKGNQNYQSTTRDESKVENTEKLIARRKREGNPLLSSIWTREVSLGRNTEGFGDVYRAWQIPKTPSPTISRSSSIKSLSTPKENLTRTVNEGYKQIEKLTGSGKLPILDMEDINLPPPYQKVEGHRDQQVDLITAIRELTTTMKGLPTETINMAIQQLIKEREKELNKE